MVVGSLQQDRWTDKDGKNQSRLKVMADRVQFLDRRIEVPVPVPAGAGGAGENGAGEEGGPQGELPMDG